MDVWSIDELWKMFSGAHPVVRAVMIGLAFASVTAWTVFIAKSVQLFLASRALRSALARVTAARTLTEAQLAAGRSRNLPTFLVMAAVEEVRMSSDGSGGGVRARTASRFADIVRTEARAARSGMAALAMIGSTAPFVGLFGTVWGIMNSFLGIAKAQTSTLAVVAPGIAEALLATAFGLFAAIPAVIFYNHLVRATKGYLDLVVRASGAVTRLLSRDLDRASYSAPLARHAAE